MYGYATVDCAGTNMAATASTTTVSGLYNRLLNAIKTGKPIMIENYKMGSDNFNAAFVVAKRATNAIHIYVLNSHVTVSNADQVTHGYIVAPTSSAAKDFESRLYDDPEVNPARTTTKKK